ncbi:hypothetical protein ACIA74_35980 [Streptomyces sp. NPDC051658]|uniref:hypothetical protein n=1 Tax=Streptomyces sp. NPDC051658 TaxID=3365667 RepID=UPI00379FE235
MLTFALAQGSWQWFATFIGVTLLAVMFAFQRRAEWTPGIRSAYMRGLVAYALVVGLCVAIALALLLQRQAWLSDAGHARRLRAARQVPGPPGGGRAGELGRQ